MMSDATLPPPAPRATSRPPASQDDALHNSSSGEGEFDTSFDSSGLTLVGMKDESAGDSEGKGDAKQKRKRTSPKDQAVLETEYKQNPKPNKAARAEIVEKVSLNEKEVQIWFQNRRQINRRKSRPLLPHEIAAFGLGGMAALSSDPAQMMGMSSSQSIQEPIQDLQVEVLDAEEEESQATQVNTPEQMAREAINIAKVEMQEVLAEPTLPQPTLKRRSSAISENEESSFTGQDHFVKSFNSTPGYLANRWNNVNGSFSSPAATHKPAFTTPNTSQSYKPTSCGGRLERSFSSPNVRLSMSLDGKAELVSASPSPPRAREPRPFSSEISPPQKRMRTLERSQSALPYPTQASSSSISPFVPSLGRGRSRDARTWQILADGDLRDELTAQAERESNGSAIAAIGLIRSTSNTALKASSTKRNTTRSQQNSSKSSKKPKLGRAQSSLARLQYTTKAQEIIAASEKEGLVRSPSGDSDKENWLPGEAPVNPRRKPLPSARTDKLDSTPRTVLGDNHKIPTHATNLGGRSRKRKSADLSSAIFEDTENAGEEGEDVQKFMSGEVSPGKKGDLDCIQGLLSLSQGNWR